MKLAIMQPYLFPYIGYFQLINAVDTFVFYDDVNYIKKGWINRNSILVQGQPHTFTLELQAASQNKLINQIICGSNKNRILKKIQHSYSRAPEFKNVFPLISKILLMPENNLANFITQSIEMLCDFLELKKTFLFSSNIDKNNDLKGQDKILEICKKLKSEQYVNAIGGRDLYDKKLFKKNGISLVFLQSHSKPYKQFVNDFIPNLSILDIMMFNPTAQIKSMLSSYELI